MAAPGTPSAALPVISMVYWISVLVRPLMVKDWLGVAPASVIVQAGALVPSGITVLVSAGS